MGTFLLILASALWGAVHSWVASLGFKDSVQRIIGTSGMNWYRLGYNIFSVITFLPLLIMTAALPDQPLYAMTEPWSYLAFFLQILAFVVLVIGVLQTDVWSFIGVRQILGGQMDGSMITGGLYRYVRHPLYTAGLVFIWLTPVMTVNRLVLYISLTIYILIGIYFEERKLVREFGDDYLTYRKRTPMLIPLLF